MPDPIVIAPKDSKATRIATQAVALHEIKELGDHHAHAAHALKTGLDALEKSAKAMVDKEGNVDKAEVKKFHDAITLVRGEVQEDKKELTKGGKQADHKAAVQINHALTAIEKEVNKVPELSKSSTLALPPGLVKISGGTDVGTTNAPGTTPSTNNPAIKER